MAKPTLRQRKMLDAQAVQAGQASTPPSTGIDMVIEETPLDQQETIEECNVPLEIAAIKTLLGQQQDSIEENGELITTAGAKIFELEPVINKIEEEFPIVKNKLRAYCKQTLDSFSDELDDMARADRDKWDCVHESGKMSELIDKVSEENATLKEKIKTQKSALIKQKIALKEEKDANKQLKSDVASMMRRLVAVEDVVHPAMCEAAEQRLGELGV
ncbi:hypothetical protein HZS61_014487 [Fusarium oxysporum f. sp. conglutinans]|uniref:Uncharacterized protein n=1 Tax=Fusarium oxysporum f. sp. conglutinans TaxID=100902 RepID=A0A8H6GQP1_FUSOX|nr:hypothetical protein HZS61_014487 [Fusarium oxysporum f. sp. conglutinans]